MATGDQILKSWLRQKYTDNNTLKTTFQESNNPDSSGDTLVVPNTSNTLAEDTDINTLVASLRKMQNNTYLRHSPLWSSVNIQNVSEGALIAEPKKTDIDNLMTDLLAMHARYSKTATGCNYAPNTPTAFGSNDTRFTSFGNNSGNATSFDRTCFFWGSNYGSQKSGNTRRFTFSNFAEYATAFSRGGGTFTQRSGNATEFGAHTLTFTQRFNADFVVKSDGSVITNTNVVN